MSTRGDAQHSEIGDEGVHVSSRRVGEGWLAYMLSRKWPQNLSICGGWGIDPALTETISLILFWCRYIVLRFPNSVKRAPQAQSLIHNEVHLFKQISSAGKGKFWKRFLNLNMVITPFRKFFPRRLLDVSLWSWRYLDKHVYSMSSSRTWADRQNVLKTFSSSRGISWDIFETPKLSCICFPCIL